MAAPVDGGEEAARDAGDDLEERMLRPQLGGAGGGGGGGNDDGDNDDAGGAAAGAGNNNNNNNNNDDDDEDDEDADLQAALAAAFAADDEQDEDEDEDGDQFLIQGNPLLRRRLQQRQAQQARQREQALRGRGSPSGYLKLHYCSLSMLSAAALVLYALRTRGQAYLALTYLTSSKASYIFLGNAVVAGAVSAFQTVVNLTLSGLRPAEAERIGENVRWNVTETCIALTIFRSEVDVNMGGMFLALVFAKCLHWAAELRGSHLRMTEEVFYFIDPPTESSDGNATSSNDDGGGSASASASASIQQWAGTVIAALLPKPLTRFIGTAHYRCPRIPPAQIKFLALVHTLLLVDCMAMAHCGLVVADQGPSVHILFGFEAAILATSALSTLATYSLHVVDGWVTVLHHLADPSYRVHGLGLYHGADEVMQAEVGGEDGGEADADADADGAAAAAPQTTAARRLVERISSSWRDRRATLSFTIELAAHALRFLFYLLFFAIVFTYYGMPINIFREVYVSYQQLRQRLTSFANYRRLTANMNERFESVTSDEELDEVGRTCIICRDGMDAGGACKKLPGCGHCFHGHCLREWLVQQQSCPTCRGDIQANEARVKAERAARDRETTAEEAATGAGEAGEESDARAGDGVSAMEISSIADADGGGDQADSSPAAAVTTAASAATAERSFPCLYRVTAAGPGATVHSDENGRSIIRTVPTGKIVLCTDAKQGANATDPNEEGGGASNDASRRDMLSIPDGWVMVSDVERVRPLVPMNL